MLTLPIFVAVLATSGTSLPDPAWAHRRVGERHLYVPGLTRPPLVLEIGPKKRIQRLSEPTVFSLRIRVYAWLDSVPFMFEYEDAHRLWFLVNDGRTTRWHRRQGGIFCGVVVRRRAKPGDVMSAAITFQADRDSVTTGDLFPSAGKYHVQVIYDQGEFIAESNWITVDAR